MDEKRQIQKEFFEEFAETGRKRHIKEAAPGRVRRSITVSSEQLVFAAMALIIVAAISYSVGVERGKRAPYKKPHFAKEAVPPAVKNAEQTEKSGGKAVSGKMPSVRKNLEKEAKAGYGYTIQAASYTKRDDASREASILKKNGIEASFFLSGRYYVVCAGDFKNRKAASSSSEWKKLRKRYPDCYIRKR